MRFTSQDNFDRHDNAERMLHAELHRPVRAPDLTRNIMGRLGYMQVAPKVARRRRVRRWLDRCAVVAVMVVTGTLGVMVFNASPESRQPLESTMPSAVRSDIQYHQHQFNSVIQIFREIPARIDLETAAPAGVDEVNPLPLLDEDVDQSAVAPVRWI